MPPTDPVIAACLEALQRNPHDTETLARLGALHHARGEMEQARTFYFRALGIDPAHFDSLAGLGKLSREVGLLEEAEGFYRTLTEAHPHRADAWYDLGNLLRDLRKLERACTVFRKTLTLNPTDERARHLLSVLEGQNPQTPPDAYVQSLFDPVAERFDHHLVHRLRYHTPEHLAKLARELRASGERFGTALDLGCGTGLSGLAFRSLAKHLAGVDLAPNMVARARLKGVYDALTVSGLNAFLDTTRNHWDLFIATDVFIYIGALETLFEKATLRAAPGAWFAFSTESVEGPDFEALPTGRYAHSMFYIQKLADRFSWEVAACRGTDIREEHGDPVPGHLFILKARNRP